MKTVPKKFSLAQILFYLAFGSVVGASGYWYGRTSALAQAALNAKEHNGASGSHASVRLSSENRASLDDFLNGKGKPNADDLTAWAKNLSPAERAAALKELQSKAAGMPRDAILAALVDAWAATDPKGFLAAPDSVASPRLREEGMDAALKSWAAQDPQKALQWLKDNPGTASNAMLQSRYAAAIAGYASVDPQDAFNTVSALSENTPGDQRMKSQALQAFVGALADQGNFTGGVAMLAQLPAGNMQNQAYLSLATSWAQSNPVDASTWVASLTDPTQRSALGAQVVSSWAGTDPQAAATWAAQMDQQAANTPQDPNNPTATNYLLTDAIRTWSAYDLDATGNFLNQMPASPDKDGAVATFAMYAGQEDPQSAMQWASTISDDQMRQRLVMVTALQMQAQDPNSYNQFISSTNMLTDQQKQMLASLPPNIANMLAGNGGGRGGRGGFGGGGFNAAGGGANPQAGGIPARIQNFIISGTGLNFITNGGPNNIQAQGPQVAPGTAAYQNYVQRRQNMSSGGTGG